MTDDETQINEELSPDEEAESEDETGGDQPDETDGGESEAAATAPAVRSQKEIDKLHGQLEREAERHTKRVAEIMGDDFPLLVPSPVDWTPGFIFNVPEMHPAPEQVSELHALLGQAAPVEYQAAEDAEQCDKCRGLGDVLTGSRKPGQETKPCSGCTGTGWKTKAPPLPQTTPGTYGQPPGNGATISPETYQVKDSWGRPSGHPHFGIDPVAVGV